MAELKLALDQRKKQNSFCFRLFLIVAYLFFTVLPFIFVFVFSDAHGNFLHELAKGFALAGFSLLILQVVLAGRFKPIEYPFGLDCVMNFHKLMAIFAGSMLILHPIIMSLSVKNFVLFSFKTGWQINLGKIALLLAVLIILFSLFFRRLGVDYNVWRFLHKSVIFIIIFGFAHSFLIGSDIQAMPNKIYWTMLFLAAVSIYLYRNIYFPIWGYKKYTISSVEQATHDTFTLTMTPDNGQNLYRDPGQFMFLKLKRPGRKSELHPFTISASPLRADILEATIKKSGNFTNTIDQTRPGDKAYIEAPFGRFSFIHHNPKKILFIAGGIGVTPIMSMIRYLRETNDSRPVMVIYANKTEGDIVFRRELDDLPKNFKVVYTLDKPQACWSGPTGHVTPDLIKQYASDILGDADVYLCGPPIMMDKVITAMRTLGVSDKKIHYERFTI